MSENYNPLLGDFETFYKENLGLIKKYANKFMKKTVLNVEFDDLFQQATVGFLKAYREYDGRGEFSTFAHYKIYGELTWYLREKAPLVPVSEQVYRFTGQIFQLRMEKNTPEEVAAKLNCTVGQAAKALKNVNNSVHESLDKDIKDGFEVYSIVAKSEDYTGVFVEEFTNRLTDKQKDILQFLLLGKSLREIGRVQGVSYQRIGFIKKDIARKATGYFGIREALG